MIKETHIVECFCDVCGKSHDLCRKYEIPDPNYEDDEFGALKLCKKVEFDLCPRCAKSIAHGIKEMKRRKFMFEDCEL